jgi:molybdopterin molybdotransferase
MEHLSVAQAQQCILQYANKQGVETVGLEQSLGRVLAMDVRANRDQPPYDVSAMDGYALRSADLAQVPATLVVVEDIKAGDMPVRVVGAGQCARIMTGAPVPQGADAVIRVEDTQAISESNVQINRPVKPGNDIRRLGENMRNGEVVLAAGTEITPGVIGILATVKCAQLQVYCRPRVAILSTGNELEGMDEPVDPNRIPDSNSYALMAQLQALGIAPAMLGIARDDPAELAEYLQRGLEFDVLLVSGGSSVGVHDYVRPTIEALGVQMKFWRVAMKPGHPLAFGVLQRSGQEKRDAFFFGLPGNPVSSMVCFEEFVAPLLRGMMGHARWYRRTVQARLGHDVKHQPGRTEFVRVMLKNEQGNYLASSTGTQSSGVSLSMARADGLVVVPAASTGMTKGELVTVQLLDGTVFQDDVGFGE